MFWKKKLDKNQELVLKKILIETNVKDWKSNPSWQRIEFETYKDESIQIDLFNNAFNIIIWKEMKIVYRTYIYKSHGQLYKELRKLWNDCLEQYEKEKHENLIKILERF